MWCLQVITHFLSEVITISKVFVKKKVDSTDGICGVSGYWRIERVLMVFWGVCRLIDAFLLRLLLLVKFLREKQGGTDGINGSGVCKGKEGVSMVLAGVHKQISTLSHQN